MSQKYFDQLTASGWQEDQIEPDVIIINSCSVTKKADKSSYLLIKKERKKHPDAKIFVGGAPVNNEFCKKIGADFYAPDPQGAVEYLGKIAS